MYGGNNRALWGYINSQHENAILHSEVSSANIKLNSFREKYQNWLIEDTKLIELLRNELKKERWNHNEIKTIAEQMVKHHNQGVNLSKEL